MNANRENVLAVRDTIAAAPDHHFDIANWFCGSAACIGGWCDRVFNDGIERDWPHAAANLGIEREQAHRLFFGFDGVDVTKPMALQALTDIADGKPFTQWSDYA
jgi:hypothetical protein